MWKLSSLLYLHRRWMEQQIKCSENVTTGSNDRVGGRRLGVLRRSTGEVGMHVSRWRNDSLVFSSRGSRLSSEFRVLANMVEMQLVCMSANEAPRLAVELAWEQFSHVVASGRCDDDVRHRNTAQ